MSISGAMGKSSSFVGDEECVWSAQEGFLLGANSIFEFAAVFIVQMEHWAECLPGKNGNKMLFVRTYS